MYPLCASNYQPRKEVLESLGVGEIELRAAVFDSFVNTPRDCHASIKDLPITLKGRTYRFEEVAHVQSWEGGQRVD